MAAKNQKLNAYQKNELSANKHMSYVLLFATFLVILAWFGFLFKLFGVTEVQFIITIIVLPIVAALLSTPLIFIKTDKLSKPWFKYYVLFLFVFAMFVLNVILPKHTVLGWAVCIALTAHYYEPKVCRIIYISVIVAMYAALSLGIFFGEFDSNLLGGLLDGKNQTIYSYLLPDTYPDTPSGRYQFLSDLIAVGHNRFIRIFTNYYIARVLFVTLIFFVVVFLNRRTRTLLKNEIQANTENQKNKTELEVARDIQLNTLPEETISEKDVEIVGELKAAKEVGGDLYDYLDIDEDHVAVLIGDVSGKGVPAAMFMMKTITSFRDFAKANKTPSQILKEVNASILKGNKSSLFVTCFLMILDKRNGKVIYSNAGHNPPIIGKNKNFTYLKCNPGFLLGCFKETYCIDEEITLKPGESITLYTDGITEARDKDGGFFGENRFLESMNKHTYTCVVELHHAIKDEISAFVNGAPQSDDITFITVKYRGDAYSVKEKEFNGLKENIQEMLNFISDFSNEHNLQEEFRKKLVIVGDELFSNIVIHGYEGKGGPIFVRLIYNEDKKEFAISIIDKAKAFNQLEVNKQAIGPDAKNVQIGGLGLIIVKKIMDEYAYDRINGKNILVLKKKF